MICQGYRDRMVVYTNKITGKQYETHRKIMGDVNNLTIKMILFVSKLAKQLSQVFPC